MASRAELLGSGTTAANLRPTCRAQAHAALPEGGAFIAIDTIIDDARRSNTFGLAMSLNMLVEFGREDAFDYTFQVRRRG